MAAGTPAPLLPDYTGGGLTAVLPALLGHHDMPAMPTEVADAQSVVLLIVDGLGWNQLQDRAGVAPTLAAMAGGAITSVAPTTTATALTSIATGCTPGEHGVVGYRTFIGGEVTNMLRWWGDVSGDRVNSIIQWRQLPNWPRRSLSRVLAAVRLENLFD